ncbi:MAG: transcriptional repressor NrdR [Clostridia bacterium]|nr:transcriptional repressor NrdR [Clostridia bacterium]
MKCPVCGATDSRVLDSRPIDDGNSIKRRRECTGCGRRFNTYEVIETSPVTVIKKDGSREFFDRHKLMTGIARACYKRDVDVGAIVTAIENELNNSLAGEVSTREIGEMVMRRLREIDAVSYVRFASVYREFRDVDTFFSELQELMRNNQGQAKT